MRLNSEYNGDQFKPFQNHAKTLLVSSDGPASRFADRTGRPASECFLLRPSLAPCKRVELSRLRWRRRQSLASSRVPSFAWRSGNGRCEA